MAQLTMATHEVKYETKSIEQARGTAVERTLDFAEELMIELGVADTIKALQDLPAQIGALQQEALSAKAKAETFKLGGLAGAKERYDQEVLAASMVAPCDGKNAEARAMQLKAHLAKDEAVGKWQAHLDRMEMEYRTLVLDAERKEVDLDQTRNRLRAMLAVAGLLEAVVRATAVRQ